MNFLTDIIASIQRTLTADGIAFDANVAAAEPQLFLAAYVEFQGRRLSRRVRNVDFSQALRSSPQWVPHEAQLIEFKSLSESGGDLTPFQSKNVGRFTYNDLLLNDWGIQHFHLGTHVPGATFANRTGELLYAIVEPDRIRCLAIGDHGSFADIELVEVVDREWPEYLDRWEVNDAVGLSYVPIPDDVKVLRAAHVQSAVQLTSGRILSGPGGGYTLAGTSLQSMLAAHRACRILANAERFVQAQEQALRAEIGGPSEGDFRCTELAASHVGITVDGAPTSKWIPIQ